MTTVYLAPTFGAGYQGFSAGGIPLNAGKIYTYAAGGTTPQATYTTSAGSVQNANPIILSADGRTPNEVWLVAGDFYRFDLKDANDNLIKTYDNLSGINDVPASIVHFIQAGAGAVADTVQDELRTLSFSPEQFGAAVAYSPSTDDTIFVQACFAAAQAANRAVLLRRLYSVSNLTFGAQNVSGQSSAPSGMFGWGTQSGFIGRGGATGTLLQAWSIAGVPWRDFMVDCNNVAGYTKGIDTEWKAGVGPDEQNRFSNVWVQNYGGTGWYNRNGNQSPMAGCVVRAPTGTSQTAFDMQGSGGQISMRSCEWIGGILDLCCQNAVLTDCSGSGVRLNKNQTGDNVIHFDAHYFYADVTSGFCVWDNAIATSGHYTREMTCTGSLFGPTVNGQSLFNIGLVGNLNMNGCVVDTASTCNFLGGSAAAKGSGNNAQIVLNGLSDVDGTLTLNAATGIDYQKRMIDAAGVITGDTGSAAYIPVLAFGGTSTGITYSTQSGRYSIENGWCRFTVQIVLTNKGSATGSATVTLPIASNSAVPDTTCSIFPQNVTYTTIPAALIGTSSTTVGIFKLASGGSSSALDDTTFTNSSTLRISGVYPVY